MTGYVLSPKARADIVAIWDFGEERWGPDQAERYLRDLQRAIETVAADPRRGRPCDEVRPGYFKFSVGSYVIFFRLEGEGIDVVRILHQRMDFDRHL
jgi:toxin ParE1/3/4